jgi:hypothetical protein
MAHFARGRECLEDLAWIIRGQPVMGVTSMIQREKPILPHLQRAGLLAGGSMGRCLGQVFAGVRSPPLRRIGHPSWDGLPGKTRGRCGGRFSRRGAVSAPGWQGRRRAEASHDWGRVGKRPVPERRGHFAWRYADITGVQSPPLRGGLAQHGWPSGGRPEMTRRWFPRRGAVSAPGWQGRTQGDA